MTANKTDVIAAGGWKEMGNGKKRLDLAGGFYLHIARVPGQSRRYAAQLKHAGGLNAHSNVSYTKPEDAIPWAREQADEFCRKVGVEGGLF